MPQNVTNAFTSPGDSSGTQVAYMFLIYDVEKVLITQIKCDNCPIQRLRTLLQSRCNDLSAISFPFFSSRLIVSQLQMHRSISFSAQFSNVFFLSKYQSSTCIYIELYRRPWLSPNPLKALRCSSYQFVNMDHDSSFLHLQMC